MVPADSRPSTSVESGLPWNWNSMKRPSSPACPIQGKDQRTNSAHFFPAGPERNGYWFVADKQRNLLWSANENPACHFLLRWSWSCCRARKPVHQSRGSSVYRHRSRSARSGIFSTRSVRSRTIQQHIEGFEGHGFAFLPLCRLVTVLQGAARGAAKCQTKI